MGQFRENKKAEIGMIVICFIILLPLFIISIYNRPSIDDYDYAVLTHRIVTEGGNFFDVIDGAVRTSKGFYNTWQGLYTSAFLLALQPGIWGAEYYTLTTIIVLATAYICIFASFYIFNKHLLGYSKVFVATASMVVLTLLVLRLPSAREGLFWFNGAMNYMPFTFLNLLNLALIYENYHTESKKRRIALIIGTTVLSFIISGGNHVTAFADILFLLCANVFLLYKKRKCAIAPLISAIIGFIIVYIAPGTAERQSAFEQQTVLNTIIQTIKHVKNVFGEWISFTWILSMLIITPIALELIKKNKEKLPKRFPLIQILCAVMVICGMFCVPYLPMGFFGAERVTNVIWITFMFLSGYIYIYINSRLFLSKRISVFGQHERNQVYIMEKASAHNNMSRDDSNM